MKPNLISSLFIGGLFALITSCGEGTKTDETTDESPCSGKNDVFLQIEKYGYQFDSTYTFNGEFHVTRSEWTLVNDSTAELSLYNFELGAASSDNNLQVKVELHAQHGKKIEAGVYPYMEYSSDLWSKTTIISPKGTVYFNWLAGMPKQGHVELKHADQDVACGTFALNVDKQDRVSIGHVVLNGEFVNQ